jgi:hypothetical protein
MSIRQVTSRTMVRTSAGKTVALAEFFDAWNVSQVSRSRIRLHLSIHGWACGGEYERIELA